MNYFNHLDAYLASLKKEESTLDCLLAEMSEEAKRKNVPIIRPEVGQLLAALLASHQPQDVLEIGTAIGYSALHMSRFIPSSANLWTVEKDQRMQQIATQYFKQADDQRIHLVCQEASDYFQSVNQPVDFIFMDGPKGQYARFLPWCLERLRPGGLLVTDNLFQGGAVASSRYLLARRQRTIHKRLRCYIQQISNHPALETVILKMGDGVSVSVKKK